MSKSKLGLLLLFSAYSGVVWAHEAYTPTQRAAVIVAVPVLMGLLSLTTMALNKLKRYFA